jgi:hypothetical protein
VQDVSGLGAQGRAIADEAALREELRALGELEARQQAKALGQRFGVTRGDVLALWRQERKRATTGTGESGKLAGRAIPEVLRPVEAWEHEVDGAAWLEECERELRRYLAMPEGAHVTCAAWDLYTHVSDCFGFAPYLLFQSPAPECGKTTAMRCRDRLARLPLSTGSMTTATLFRVVDEHHPVLLLDEQDGRLERNEELRLLLNEGFQRGSYVLRCVGDDLEPRAFDCFGPKALASIADLPATITSRSFVIRMERSKLPLAKLDSDEYPGALARLQRQAARWALDHAAELGEVPAVAGLSGRLRDKSGPLLAVAAAAGGGWLERVAEAVKALEHEAAEEADHLVLLADVGRIMAGIGWPKFMATADLLRHLNALTEAPWGESGKRGEGLSSHKLAALLRPFGVRPEDEAARNGAERRRGYTTGAIRRAWETYTSGAATVDTEGTVPQGGYPENFSAPEEPDELGEKLDLF